MKLHHRYYTNDIQSTIDLVKSNFDNKFIYNTILLHPGVTISRKLTINYKL